MAYAAIFISVLLGATGQILMKLGASAGLPPGGLYMLFLNPSVLSGMALYGLSALTWIYALTRVPLSVAYPMVSLGYILVIAVSYFLFQEPVGGWKIAGAAFIAVGVILISRG